MQLTMTGEYAVRAMMALGSVPFGTVLKIEDISGQWHIPKNFLRKIITTLTKSGLVQSQRGNGGGIRLAMSAERITLLDIIEAAEGKIFLNKCLISQEFCPRSCFCAVHTIWNEAQNAVSEVLSRRNLAEIVALDIQRRQTVMASAPPPSTDQPDPSSQQCPVYVLPSVSH